jgi:hypothetical protein
MALAYLNRLMLGPSRKVRREIQLSFMFVVLFLVSALMYPANPPAVGGDPETINYRQSLYLGYLSIPGFICNLGTCASIQKDGHNSSQEGYCTSSICCDNDNSYVSRDAPNPDEITALMDLVNGFRIASAFMMAVFWRLLGVTLGAFWDKTKPHETAKISV